MLLVGVKGSIGSGKTSLLLQLTTWFQQQHKGVEGFLAITGNRPTSDRGADCYQLQMVATGRNLLYATRDESKVPPYEFEIETERLLREWAEQLTLKGAPPLIVLDEFGSREVSGKGHVKLWDLIKTAAGRI